jgi:hypothetical protein
VIFEKEKALVLLIAKRVVLGIIQIKLKGFYRSENFSSRYELSLCRQFTFKKFKIREILTFNSNLLSLIPLDMSNSKYFYCFFENHYLQLQNVFNLKFS